MAKLMKSRIGKFTATMTSVLLLTGGLIYLQSGTIGCGGHDDDSLWYIIGGAAVVGGIIYWVTRPFGVSEDDVNRFVGNVPSDDEGGMSAASAGDGGPSGKTVQNLKVLVDLEHPDVSELDIRLISPSGEVIVLHEAGQPGPDNTEPGVTDKSCIMTWYGDITDPAQGDLSALDGTPLQGDWTLEIEDTVPNGKSGTLYQWAIQSEGIEGETEAPLKEAPTQP